MMIMSKIFFTNIQIQKLSKNKWIKNITSKGITYTDDFKIKLVKEYEDYNNFRYQWNLKKMTPIQYRNHLLESIT